ncbi:MAG: tetraacyldisaccharide 4'-kinase [Polyangiaceae bacterium UTPRO1]|nr:tetraacyldisaccharide 4'-kinase [Myxococcales bacterium]OQY68851.1 MAG: tetraacyldisaccharide 4'-kinase [Polyangiaceae bacterium UTPRO1]
MSGPARAVERLWSGAGLAARVGRALLTPAAGLYAAGVGMRNAAYRTGVLRSRAVAARTVSIGNVRVGGTGKTPLTRWLAERIHARGVPVAILTRGYGGSARGAHVVGDGERIAGDVARSGDEAVMLARTSAVPVVAGADRAAAAALAIATFGSRILVCDDAFQHRALRRNLDLVLVDAGERGGLARLLPAGPLREPLCALKRADVVLIREAGNEADPLPTPAFPGQRVLRVRFAPTVLMAPAAASWREIGLAALAGQRVLAVSAVARPAALYEALRAWEVDLAHVLEYPDHHPYDVRDWHAIAAAAKDVDLIVTTEKDLVKLEVFPFARGKLVALRLGVEVEDGEALVTEAIGDVMTGAA